MFVKDDKKLPSQEIRKYVLLTPKEKAKDFSDAFRHWRDPFQVIHAL